MLLPPPPLPLATRWGWWRGRSSLRPRMPRSATASAGRPRLWHPTLHSLPPAGLGEGGRRLCSCREPRRCRNDEGRGGGGSGGGGGQGLPCKFKGGARLVRAGRMGVLRPRPPSGPLALRRGGQYCGEPSSWRRCWSFLGVGWLLGGTKPVKAPSDDGVRFCSPHPRPDPLSAYGAATDAARPEALQPCWTADTPLIRCRVRQRHLVMEKGSKASRRLARIRVVVAAAATLDMHIRDGPQRHPSDRAAPQGNPPLRGSHLSGTAVGYCHSSRIATSQGWPASKPALTYGSGGLFVGCTGAGKTSLLSGLLSELHITAGRAGVRPASRVAVVEQVPDMVSGTTLAVDV